jgi:hypothetical protein
MACKLCETRRARRLCPGVGGEICSVCCGTERENTISCPLDCEYLQQARGREQPREIDPESVPNRDTRVTEEFLEKQATLVAAMMHGLVTSALGLPGVVDLDVREALDSLTRTFRTRESGLYYESKPANLLAAQIHELMQKGLEEFRKAAVDRLGMSTIRDSDVFGVLVFLQHLELQLNNGRRRGRAFLDALRQQVEANQGEAGASPGSPLVLP